MNTSEIRSAFLDFFAERGHRIVPSDSLVPEHDPTLLFTGAGMNQFKDQFLGKGDLSNRRAASCQKCFRADDIDEVGRTACHHTFFEMLGNFSFGDYFKREAIEWAWEFLLDRLRINPDKLYVSVYNDDAESYGIWRGVIGLHPERIYRFGEHDNFWPADAPTKSPEGTLCGPCTEIFYDIGRQPACPNPAACDITCDCKRYVEIWNLVLQQFEKGASPGDLRPLPMQNIDTGMGLERTAAVMQGVVSNFDNDVFRPIVEAVVGTLGIRYRPEAAEGRCVRRIADHVRAVSFLISDGVLPANDGRGYVERRLIRRAMRDGFELGASKPFLFNIVPCVADVMHDAYPELRERRENIARIIKAEEERFHTTLANGSRLINELVAELKAKRLRVLPGEEAFRLYDTYGLPLELTESILADHGMMADREGFERELERQRTLARSTSSMSADVFDTGPVGKVKALTGPTVFCGYETPRSEATIAAILVNDDLADAADAGAEATIVLDRTPFYGEAGGQMGDTGVIESANTRIEVLDTKRTGGYFLHACKVAAGRIERGQKVTCAVDVPRREAIRRAHTATHLLHNALRTVLGKHVEQAGSLVAPDRLRFDFSHFAALTRDEIGRVEEIVNANILGDAPVSVAEMPLAEAKKTGAIALFGEKYGETVRVVRIGDYSIELCGGTHLASTASVGLFRVTSESSIAAGVRRIEAVTGFEALRDVRRREGLLESAAAELGCDEGRVPERLRQCIAETRELRAEIKKLKKRGAGDSADDIAAAAAEVAGVRLVAHKTSLKVPDLRELCDLLKRKLTSGVVVLVSDADGKLAIVVGVTKDLVPRLDAGKIVKEIASVAGGTGGGRPDLAQAGAKDPAMADAVLAAAPATLKRYLEGTPE